MAPKGADASVFFHVGWVVDEDMLILAIVALNEEHAAHTTEGHAVVVGGLTVHAGAGAVTRVVDDLIVDSANLAAQGKTAVCGSWVVGVVGGDHEEILTQWDHSAVLQTCFEPDGFILVVFFFQVVLLEESGAACAVVEDGRPAGVDCYVNRPLVGGADGEGRKRESEMRSMWSPWGSR